MHNHAILIDSSLGLNEQNLKQYHDVYLVPLILILPSGKEIEDSEKKISYNEFYEILDKECIKTSQIPIGRISQIWDELLKKYKHIIFIGLSKGLSGQHNNFYVLSQNEKYLNKVFIIDTDGVSQINKFIFEKIYEWIYTDDLSLEKLQNKVNNLKNKFCAFIIPKNLETLKRGGRISPAAASLANMLKIIPILRYDGQIDKFEKTRTFKKAIITAINEVKLEHPDTKKIVLAYSKVEPEDLALVRTLIKDKKLEISEECRMPNVIAAHTGANTFSLISWDVPENNTY